MEREVVKEEGSDDELGARGLHRGCGRGAGVGALGPGLGGEVRPGGEGEGEEGGGRGGGGEEVGGPALVELKDGGPDEVAEAAAEREVGHGQEGLDGAAKVGRREPVDELDRGRYPGGEHGSVKELDREQGIADVAFGDGRVEEEAEREDALREAEDCPVAVSLDEILRGPENGKGRRGGGGRGEAREGPGDLELGLELHVQDGVDRDDGGAEGDGVDEDEAERRRLAHGGRAARDGAQHGPGPL
mmetsp:Transcript_21809/g.68335  ORF Transcript_21809/g.68335 Transcript_21809/m.68335 type:complete len:245 (-) Transcript_21809:1203-1937(-)